MPKEGLREPPGYGSVAKEGVQVVDKKEGGEGEEPPSYDDLEREEQDKEDVIHHLNHPQDTIQSLSLLYKISPSVIRAHNNLSSDHLLQARNYIRIPRSHYSGPSLSPTSHLSDEELERRKKTRRFMIACKVADYDVAVLYLEEAGWDEDKATERWREDEVWEREHPLKDGDKGKEKEREKVWKRRFMGKSSS